MNTTDMNNHRPRIVCLCGSTRFRDDFVDANRRETLASRIVVAPGVFAHTGDAMTDEDKQRLDRLHFRKIDLADEIIVVNPGDYIGYSTRREIQYAESTGKRIRYLYPPPPIPPSGPAPKRRVICPHAPNAE